MKPKIFVTILAGLIVLVGAPACSSSPSANITHLVNSRGAITAVIPTAAGPVYPLMPPDPQQGQAIYAEKCAACHGDNGLGNGPQASQLPNPIKPIGLAETARQSIPAEWFSVITQGNQAEYMMPFGSSLSDQQRWDVLAYVYTLSASDKTIAEGKAVYDASCASCHNKQVKNVSAQSDSAVSDLSNQEHMAGLSEADFYKTIHDGVHPDMPAYRGSLSDEQLWAVSSYVRTLSFSVKNVASRAQGQPDNISNTSISMNSAPAGAPATTPTSAPAPTAISAQTQNSSTTGTPQANTKGSVNGSVTPPSGSSLPSGLTVALVGSDNNQAVLSQTTPLKADGSFSFNDIDMPSGRVFMTFVIYKNYEFDSDIATISDSRSLSLPITLYDTSTDKSPLVSESMHVLFDFTQAGLVQVIELFVISNPTSKMIVAHQPGQPVIDFALPTGISNLEVDSGMIGQRYIQTADGIGDTAGVKPGTSQTQVGFAYTLPYQDQLDLDLPVPIPAKLVNYMLPTNTIKLQSSQLTSAGQQSAQGMTLYIYTANNVSAGQVISVSLSGKPAASSAASAGSSSTTIWIGAGVFALALGTTGFFIIRSRRVQTTAAAHRIEEPEIGEDVDSLLDAIAALDDIHAAKGLPDPAYQQRRAELKAKLAILFKPSDDEDGRG